MLALTTAIFLMFAPTPTAPNPFTAVEDAMRNLVAEEKAPSLAAAAISGGKAIWMHAQGWADREQGLPATPQTVYRIGSVSKAITGTAIALALHDGLLRREAEICIPVITNLTQSCTSLPLIDVLNMAASMPQSVFYPGLKVGARGFATSDLTQSFAFSVTGRNPDFYAYSNLGPELAARTLAEKTGVPFDAFLRERVFAPLAMRTAFSGMADAPVQLRAASYNRRLERFANDYEILPLAGAGMTASLEDMSGFALAHLGGEGQLLDNAVLAIAHAPLTQDFCGFGWGHITGNGRSFLISDGQVNGGEAFIILEPARGMAAIAMSNAGSGNVAGIALSVLESMAPGAIAAFEEGVGAIEARLAGNMPPAGGLTLPMVGLLYLDGPGAKGARAIITLARREDGAMGLGIGDEALRATPHEPEGPYQRWSVACPAILPACAGDSEAEIYLQMAGTQIAGYISVTGAQGQFPYAVLLSPVPGSGD